MIHSGISQKLHIHSFAIWNLSQLKHSKEYVHIVFTKETTHMQGLYSKSRFSQHLKNQTLS